MDKEVKEYWNNLSINDRIKLLSDSNLWDGFSHYLYKYIPEVLKAIIRLKIEEKTPLNKKI